MFLKFWADACKRQQDQTANASPPQDLLPIYDRTVNKNPNNIEAKILNEWYSLLKMFSGGKEPDNPKSLKLIPSPEISLDVVRFTLDLTREDIQTLRERLKRESSASPSPKELRLSTFVVTYSYVLTCLIRARGGEPSRPIGYGFAVDCRGLLDPPVPSSYFGNCVSATFKMLGLIIKPNGSNNIWQNVKTTALSGKSVQSCLTNGANILS